MAYFNPRIYNYKNLKDDDKIFVDGMISAMDVLDNLIISEDGIEESDTLGNVHEWIISQLVKEAKKVRDEFSNKIIEDAKSEIYSHIVEVIVSSIDYYDDSVEIEEQDTDDYLYGREE